MESLLKQRLAIVEALNDKLFHIVAPQFHKRLRNDQVGLNWLTDVRNIAILNEQVLEGKRSRTSLLMIILGW